MWHLYAVKFVTRVMPRGKSQKLGNDTPSLHALNDCALQCIMEWEDNDWNSAVPGRTGAAVSITIWMHPDVHRPPLPLY